METTQHPTSTRDRGRHQSLAVRSSASRAASSSTRCHTPHSPRTPLYADTFNIDHPPIPISSSPPTSSSASTTTAQLSSPTHSISKGTDDFQYTLRSTRNVPLNPASEQQWPRTNPDIDAGDDDIDGDLSDDGSAHRPSMRRSSTKVSASSSSRFFRSIVYKFGRTFHRKDYFLPHDKQEQERNNLQHEISVEVHEGELHLCPVVNPRRVLDVGTGTGIWAVDFAKRHPDSEVLGIDLNPVPPPPFIVPNCQFVIADVDEEWKFNRPFDFIHVRSLGEPADKHHIFKSIYDNLAPGGWVEFQEWLLHVQSPDRSLEGTAFHKWNRLIAEGTKKLGKSLFFILDYKNLLEQAGFQNVVELKFAVPTNAWAPGKQTQRIGTLQKTNTLQVIDIYSLNVFTQGLGWTKEALDALLVSVRKDIEDTRIHSYSTLMTVYCQKPPSSSAPSIATTGSSSKHQRPSV